MGIQYPIPERVAKWLVLVTFCTLTFINAKMFVTFSAQATLFKEYYGVTQSQINQMVFTFKIDVFAGPVLHVSLSADLLLCLPYR